MDSNPVPVMSAAVDGSLLAERPTLKAPCTIDRASSRVKHTYSPFGYDTLAIMAIMAIMAMESPTSPLPISSQLAIRHSKAT